MRSVTIRPAAVAGRFYSGQRQVLRADVEELLAAAPVQRGPSLPKMLIVPHAGYVYSGPIAASAYALLAGAGECIRRVVLLGPAHRVAVSGLAVPTASAFETPLGRVAIDRRAIALIDDLPQVVADDRAHADEHALEVQLPFLQTVLGDFELLPLAVGRTSATSVAEVLERLWGGDETLIVISTDLSHYLDYRSAQAADRETAKAILRLDSSLDHDQACGATPLAGALLAARAHGLTARLLDLRNSGDTAGDRSRVVGYCAVALEPVPDAAVTRAGDDAAAVSTLGSALLVRARNAIADAFGLPQWHEPTHPAMAAPGATFVTLRRQGKLRGCIGTLTTERALGDDVRFHALCAAFRDSRFQPLTPIEFDDLEIEVSLLEPALPLPVRDEAHAHELLRPGIDGVVLEWGRVRATFLPQVWADLPDPKHFLGALKHKAGLPRDFWAADVKLSRYRVRKFVDTGEGA